MIDQLPAAIQSLSTALRLGRALSDIHDHAKNQDKLVEFNDAIISAQQLILAAQQQQQSLAVENQKLRDEISAMNTWDAESEEYDRTEFAVGRFAYLKRGYEGELLNAHKLCCNCFENKKLSTLQTYDVPRGRLIGLRCPNRCPDLEFSMYIDMR